MILIEMLEVRERPAEVLEAINNLDLSKAKNDHQVELSLLAADSALAVRDHSTANRYLQSAKQSITKLPDSQQPLARFALKSLTQRLLSQTDPSKAREELLSELEGSLREISRYQLSPAEGDLWICARLMLGRTFSYWIQDLVEHAVMLDDDAGAQITRVKARAEQMAIEWATTDLFSPTLALSHGYLAGLLNAQQNLALDDPLRPLLEMETHLQAVRKLASDRGLEDLVEASLGRLTARQRLRQVRRLAQLASGRIYTDVEAGEVKAKLTEARNIALGEISAELAAELLVVSFEAAFSSRNPEWRKQATITFGGPPELLDGQPRLKARYLVALARLASLNGQNTEALDYCEQARQMYLDWLSKAKFNDEGLTAVKMDAQDCYEQLIEVLLAQKDQKGAFEAAFEYHSQESLALFAGSSAASFSKGESLKTVQEKLSDKQALALFFPGRRKLYAFLLTASKLQSHSQAISGVELAQTVEEFQEAIIRITETKELAQSLYQLFWDDFEPALKQVDDLRIAPSSSLVNLPWAALKNAAGQNLGETHPSSIIFGSASLGKTWKMTQLQFHGLGDPDNSLPAARTEVKKLAQIADRAKVAEGEQADRQFVKEYTQGALHLATHGVINFRKPDQSYLLLAGGDKLSAGEISHLKLGSRFTNFAVLSACDSGKTDGGRIGHRSLAGAFLKAGSSCVLASLWPVDDEATSILMQSFYRTLKHDFSPARALQAAQLELIESPKFSHPYYWSAFAVFE